MDQFNKKKNEGKTQKSCFGNNGDPHIMLNSTEVRFRSNQTGYGDLHHYKNEIIAYFLTSITYVRFTRKDT